MEINKLFEKFGHLKIARWAEVSPQITYRWKDKGFIPADYIVLIESNSNKQVKRQELRPDLYK